MATRHKTAPRRGPDAAAPPRDHAPRDHYAEVTAGIVAELERGVRPWRRAWRTGGGGPGAPRNGVSGRHYRGINLLLLLIRGLALATPDPRWMTYNQAAGRGWQVRRGERATTVFFFKRLAVRDADAAAAGEGGGDGGGTGADGRRFVPLLRAFSVFNAAQVDGVPPLAAEAGPAGPAWSPPEAVETIASNSGVRIVHGGDRAFYVPTTDSIALPPPGAFESAEAYAAVKAHELAHASGAKHRLDRDLTGRFGSDGYAREELRAELASAMLGAELGLDTDVPGHASYLASWLDVLRGDKREIFRAAADAARIADWMLGLHPHHAARLAAERAARAAEEAGEGGGGSDADAPADVPAAA